MKNTIKFCFTFIFLLILALINCKRSYGITYFTDNFQDGTLSKWSQNIGNIGDTLSWYVLDGFLHSKVSKGGFSYLYANVTNLPRNYLFSADVENISGVDQQFVFRVSDNKKEYYLVDYRYNDVNWSWDYNNIKVIRVYSDGYKTLGVYPSDLISRNYDITQGVFHHLKIAIKDNNIKVYFDDSLAMDVGDTDIPLEGSGVGLMTWGGDFPNVSENIYKDVQIDSIDSSKPKVVILPGLGASWS